MSQTFDAYLPEIRRRHQQEPLDWEARRTRAWADAHRIAALLRADFGANEIFVFGSLVGTGRFDERSDIDIAVRGIAPGSYYRAVARVMALTTFEIDLIDMQDCPPFLLQAIESEGVAL